MNKKQKIVIWFGMLLIVGMGLYPPWIFTFDFKTRVQTWAEFGIGHIVELRNTVRNRILDFALAVWKEEPKAGDANAEAAAQLESTRVTQIFKTTVHGGAVNLVGTASDSTISFNITTNDFSSLENILRENGVEDEDIRDLGVALKTDDKPESKGKFGPKVSAWVAKMMHKAADGSWAIGVGAGGSFLAQVIGKYYGLIP